MPGPLLPRRQTRPRNRFAQGSQFEAMCHLRGVLAIHNCTEDTVLSWPLEARPGAPASAVYGLALTCRRHPVPACSDWFFANRWGVTQS